jgi:hypothetical protein
VTDESAIVGEIQREVAGVKAQLSDCCPKMKKDLTNLERELAKLKAEIRATRPKTGPLPPPAADVAVPPAPKAAAPAQKSSNSSQPPNQAPPPPKPTVVTVSPPPTPPKPAKQFPPSLKKGGRFEVPDGIIAHLTRECGGNMRDRHVVDVTCGSFEKETCGANPHSVAYDNQPYNAAKNAADLESDLYFYSAFREKQERIPHTRNNWICYNFKERKIVPTHYTIRTNFGDPGGVHLKSWLVETSADGENWREVAREENNTQLNDAHFTAIFAVADGGECRFIRLVNIGRNHWGSDSLKISAWEIFGVVIE